MLGPNNRASMTNLRVPTDKAGSPTGHNPEARKTADFSPEMS